MKNATQIWLGIKSNKREIFRSAQTPTFSSHGHIYSAAVGPFRTIRGATFMRDHGTNNPHCHTVSEAERIAAGFKYDMVLHKWIK